MDRDAEHKILDWFSPELLTEFIDELREAGYNIGVSQYIAAHDLILSLTSQDLLLTPDRLGNFLGPILCSSSVEQEDFRKHFRKWVERIVETKDSSLSEQLINSHESLAVELSQIKKKSRRFKFILFAILFSLLLWMGFNLFPQPTAIEILEPIFTTEETEPEESSPLTEESDSLNKRKFDWRIAIIAIILYFFASGGAYFAHRWWWLSRASLFLKRRETIQNPPLEQISFDSLEDSLFDNIFVLKTAQRLRHRIRVSSNKLDIKKTILSSLHNGGWFTPLYTYRKVFPEYLFLIDRTNIWDHQARFIEKLTNQLKQNGVYITTYFFDKDPRICFSSVKGNPSQTLQELSSSYQEHRLVVFADTELFLEIQTAKPAHWIKRLFDWKNPVIMTPKTLGSWGREELLLAQSFIVLPMTKIGIQVMGQLMQEGSATYPLSREVPTLMPTILKTRPMRWIERNPPTPEHAKVILVGLKTYLGDDGFYWLAACAVFPELRWNITLYLGNVLKAQKGCSLLESCSFTNLARLPWYRYGYMPDWFRGYLIATLTQKQQEAIRLTLQELLISAIGGSVGSLQLEIAKQYQSILPQLTRPILRLLAKQAPENTALKDYIFLDFMLSKSQLAVEIPEEIVPILHKYSQTNVFNGRKISIFLASNIIIGLLVYGLWSLSLIVFGRWYDSTPNLSLGQYKFVCKENINPPTTFVITPEGQELPFILWQSDFFSQTGDPPLRRCQEVTNRMNQYLQSGSLRYVSHGIINTDPVICVTDEKGHDCTGLLFRLRRGIQDPDEVLREFLELSRNNFKGNPLIQ